MCWCLYFTTKLKVNNNNNKLSTTQKLKKIVLQQAK